MQRGWSEISLAVNELSLLNPNDHSKSSTLIFLGVSNLLLHILDRIGPTMTVLRQDIHTNVERLQEFYLSKSSLYSSLEEVLKKEKDEGTARKNDSCSRAILWLTRSMIFTVSLLERLIKDSESRFEQIVEEAYSTTLKPWHGWISSAAFKIAIKLIPERKEFMAVLAGKEQDHEKLKKDIKSLVLLLQPLLDEVQALLRNLNLDKIKST
ncbi:Glycolipid transfer protein [Dioscorea alata]|uniref:Glycolipid transfer protein n=1 Tax=Dioscorea alata TaxID=55571 RepID=A0ACB7WB41_DIOAL|nr:Glycolipid transfer protein [Dioscorea alata]